jgi:hypothetical protein
LSNFVSRIYYGFRNLGVAANDRALNYAATNAFQALAAIERAVVEGRVDVRTIDVQRSPICRLDSDCYDVRLMFFDPENITRANLVFRFTVDVSAVMPVTIGVMRTWYE